MRQIVSAALALMLLALASPITAFAGDPLFVNMTTDEPHRAKMAIHFARKQQERDHPVTVFLNDKGVLVGAKANAEKFKEHHTLLNEIMQAGGNVVACPMCMEHYGVEKEGLLHGIRMGNPELTGKLLFDDDDTKTLTW